MKLRFLLVLTAIMAMVTFVGCELEDDADADGTSSTDVTSTTDTTTTDTVTNTGLDYRYVRVDDLSNITDGQDPGADIDAIILEKANGTNVFASNVEAFQLGVDVGDNIDPQDALNAPDSVVNYTDSFPTCNADAGFVSLGGSGYLVVAMDQNIEVGDSVAVIEVGGCDYGGGEAKVEMVKVQVSVAAEPDNLHWVTLGQGEGPYLSLDVSSLPVVLP